jgi:hypothetical protein
MTVERHHHHRHHRPTWKERMADAWTRMPFRRKQMLIKIFVGVGIGLMAILIGVAITLVL